MPKSARLLAERTSVLLQPTTHGVSGADSHPRPNPSGGAGWECDKTGPRYHAGLAPAVAASSHARQSAR
jgi:hypothetical protein